jgi:bla regulator protein blaR1
MIDALVPGYLVGLSAATTFAALLVALARGPLRESLGARAAYWLWLAVPMSALALTLPHFEHSSGNAAPIAPGLVISQTFADAVCGVWALGVAAALAVMIVRQRSFARSLGTLEPLPDGTWRSRTVAEPMLIGALRPRVLVPFDFERHYSAEEREFVLAHERAHLRRRDTLVNALGALWLCLFWYNPLMYWSMRLLRFDQDLACDAAVLASAGKKRRGRYAEALLKAQLAGEEALPLPIACHWGSVHPLRHRIAALRRPVPGRLRHAVGMLCAATLIASASLAARAVQPGALVAPPSVTTATRHVCPRALRRARERQQARIAAAEHATGV